MSTRIALLTATVAIAAVVVGCKPSAEPTESATTDAAPPAPSAAPALLDPPKLFVPPMGEEINVPDGLALDKDNNVYMSVPNYVDPTNHPGKIMKITVSDTGEKTMEVFSMLPPHPESGMVHPMGLEFGPDGNLYLADNQLFNNPTNKSRLLRINIVDGKPTGCDVVVQGFVCANAVVWKGNTVYVSDTVFKHVPNESLTSGTYAIDMDEWKEGVVTLAPYTPEAPDAHLIALYKTSGRIGFGADGLCFDGEGNLYCGIFEDGVLFKTTFDESGKPKETAEFAKADNMACCDGIIWRKADNRIYVADMLINGVQAVDMEGNVTTIHKNGDTTGADGSLDQPCEVLERGDELIVISMDMPWESDLLTNSEIDEPYTVSAITLK